ncbi:hypothetical protein NDU88_002049 [Pleurodeles waltl]|uniref:Uncharacterized protein n=1 Tax=Pleurodeles waltl TaxID=8319 RepID=A0AAV7TJJ3_PLEWA|nr:hypothetical protein NDU88_002049 [Pleurodeles waltl]
MAAIRGEYTPAGSGTFVGSRAGISLELRRLCSLPVPKIERSRPIPITSPLRRRSQFSSVSAQGNGRHFRHRLHRGEKLKTGS